MIRFSLLSLIALLLYISGFHYIAVYQYESSFILANIGYLLIVSSSIFALICLTPIDYSDLLEFDDNYNESFFYRRRFLAWNKSQITVFCYMILSVLLIVQAENKTDKYYQSLATQGIKTLGTVTTETTLCDISCARAVLIDYDVNDVLTSQIFPDPHSLFMMYERVQVLHHSRYPHISEVFKLQPIDESLNK